MRNEKNHVVEKVAIRFSGDSGDGMQLVGSIFSDISAIQGNDIATFPDFPSEIRAPQGTIGGVSGFQVHFGNVAISNPGDSADVLVAMNPASLKANVNYLMPHSRIICDDDSFTDKNLEKAGFKTDDPFKELGISESRVVRVPATSLTKTTLKAFDADNKAVGKSKNMLILGLICWMYDRDMDAVKKAINNKFKTKPKVAELNIATLNAGYNFGMNVQLTMSQFLVHPANIAAGKYRNMQGNKATAWGLMAAAEKAGLDLFLGSYPITPATDILQELAKHKSLGVKTFQAEDEIAGICTSIGASFAGKLAATSTSGPGLALKSEAIGLAVMAELPLVIVNVQRGGPSTGLPTKTEQSDLHQALYGRNGESPLVVIAASSPADCFWYAFMAAKLALEHMTPVILLTDGYLGNGSEPWKIVKMSDMPDINPRIAKDSSNFSAYKRTDSTMAREWAFPGMKDFEHRIGGLEKDETGCVSHNPQNHQKMSDLRQMKVDRVQDVIPDLEVLGDETAELLVVGWGGTYGHLIDTVENMHKQNKKIAYVHFNYISPLPKNTAEVLGAYKKIVVCELNNGQFASYLRDKVPGNSYLQYNKLQGLPFTVNELVEHFNHLLEN
ncbi:MAG: 2-oxoacid:acceptor oxidoreductase subunit alpha [Bacteroidales bacterium]